MENKAIKIVSAHQLSEDQKTKLQSAICEKLGVKCDFAYAIDENVIGGFKIVDGYDVYDATVVSKIASVKKQIK